MTRTLLCDMLGIDFPIIQAGMGPFTSAELVAAVSNAGALGSLGVGGRNIDDFKTQLKRVRELTDRPFAVNFTLQDSVDDDAFSKALAARPAIITFALGDPGNRVKEVHDAGIRVMLQCTTASHARQAVRLGVDVIIAQGAEAGGFGGAVTTLSLLPQVVDIAGSIPVVAAGGIADGRGLAAALILGAQGINIGTRFLASNEAPISIQWKNNILDAESEDTIKFDVWNDIFPPGEYKFLTVPRVLPSNFVAEWLDRNADAVRERPRLQGEIGTAIEEGRFGDLLPFTGQTAGLIHEILPAGEIVRRIMTEAEETLKAARNT